MLAGTKSTWTDNEDSWRHDQVAVVALDVVGPLQWAMGRMMMMMMMMAMRMAMLKTVECLPFPLTAVVVAAVAVAAIAVVVVAAVPRWSSFPHTIDTNMSRNDSLLHHNKHPLSPLSALHPLYLLCLLYSLCQQCLLHLLN